MENQRIRISRQMLKNALIEMLETTDIGKIKISMLCEKAQINRTTFYKYYGSQYDLLKDIENDLMTDIAVHISDQPYVDGDIALADILAYVEKNRKTVLTLISTDSDFAEKIFNLKELSFMDGIFREISPGEKYWEYMKTYVYSGCYAVLIQWLSNENRETPGEMASAISHIVQTVINRPV